jgi:oxygen-independent coproporphyrinogen-3 oxidase
MEAVLREMEQREDELGRARADTIYIGGGTPSRLSLNLVQRFFDQLDRMNGLSGLQECTIEANPDDVTEEWVRALKNTPVNRVSMGVQSLNDSMLRFLGRRHTAKQALQAVELLRSEGFENISLDLMFGLPGQKISMWECDVKGLLEVSAPHLSAYALQVEEGTVLAKRLAQDENLKLPLDDEVAAMYDLLVQAVQDAGMEHYEISNFAKPGYRAHHNSGYWKGLPYVGLGPGAHSYDGASCRRWNLCSLEDYCKALSAPFEEEILTEEERYNETVMTRLRTSDGLMLAELDEKHRDYTLKMAESHVKCGLMTLKDGVLRLSERGFFVSNDIISDFML